MFKLSVLLRLIFQLGHQLHSILGRKTNIFFLLPHTLICLYNLSRDVVKVRDATLVGSHVLCTSGTPLVRWRTAFADTVQRWADMRDWRVWAQIIEGGFRVGLHRHVSVLLLSDGVCTAMREGS